VMFQGTFVLNTSSGGSPADSGVIQLKVDGVVQDGPPAIVYANHGGSPGSSPPVTTPPGSSGAPTSGARCVSAPAPW
jgi:hypothetical protein